MAKEFVIKNGFISKGDSIVSGSLSGETLNLTTTPSNDNSQTQVLVRNNTTGLVEYRDASTFSGASDTNTFVTGFTYNDNNTFTIFDNDGSSFPATINQVSGLTVNGTLSATTLDGGTIFSGGTNLLTIIESLDTYVTGGTINLSATTNTNSATIGLLYKNSEGIPHTLPFDDTFTTGGTYDNNTALITFDKNDGSKYNVDLSTIDVNDTFVTGTTFGSNQAILTRNDGTEVFKLSGSSTVQLSNPSTNEIKIDTSDTFVTGYTYDDNNTFTISDNLGSAYTATINQVSGLTVNGTLSATTLDGNILLSGGTNLLTIIESLDTYVTGGTVSNPATDSDNSGEIRLNYKNFDGIPRNIPFEDTYTTGGVLASGVLKLNKNDGSIVTITGFTSGSDTFVTGTTFASNQATLTRNDGTEVFKLTGGTNVTLSNPSTNQIKIDVSSSSSSIDTGNVLWVDNIFGNDGTALVDRQDKPWSSIATAIGNAVANDTIMVRPGNYVEPPFTLIPGTSLISQGGPKVTFISGSTTTGNFITVSGSSYMEGFTLYTPTDDSAALYFNDPTGDIVTSFHNVHFKGSSVSGGTGVTLGKGLVMDSGLGSGPPPAKIIYTELRYGGGHLNTLVEVNKGIFALDSMHVPGGQTVNKGIQANGGRLQLTNVNIGNPNCDTALSVSGTSSNKPVVVGFGFNIFNVPTGIEITSDDYDVEVQQGRLEAGTTNLLITSGLTGSNGKINLTGFIMDSTKLSVPYTWADSEHTFQYSDLGNSQNVSPILRNWSNYEVGHPNKGFVTSLGRGSEYQNGMHVHTSGTSSTDYTLSAKTPGSTFTFESLTAGEQLYIGSSQYYPDGTQLNFNGFEALYTGSTGGTYTMEFYSGGTWVDIKHQSVHHNLGYNYSNNLFGRSVASNEDVRFGIDESDNWDSLNIASFGGHTAKWIRITMVTPPASLPQFDLIWLEPSHTEINDNGVLSLFGNALYRDTLVSAGNIYGESGGVVSVDVPVGSGGIPTGWNHNIKNSGLNQNGDAIYFQAALPKGICTAYPLDIVIYYGLDPADSVGSITTSPQFITSFLARGASGTKVSDPSGGLVPTPRTIQNTPTLTSTPGSFVTSNLVETGLPINTYAGKPVSIQDISFDVDDYYEGDGFLVRIELDNDGTPNQDVTIFAVEVDVVKWTLGERIRIE